MEYDLLKKIFESECELAIIIILAEWKSLVSTEFLFCIPITTNLNQTLDIVRKYFEGLRPDLLLLRI